MMLPGTILLGLEVSPAQFGFGILIGAFDEVALTAVLNQGFDRGVERMIEQNVGELADFTTAEVAADQQPFTANVPVGGQSPDWKDPCLNHEFAAFSVTDDVPLPNSFGAGGQGLNLDGCVTTENFGDTGQPRRPPT